MKIVIEFDNSGEAFFKSPYGEPARLLREVATWINVGEKSGRLVDANEQPVGTWTVTE